MARNLIGAKEGKERTWPKILLRVKQYSVFLLLNDKFFESMVGIGVSSFVESFVDLS